jgi:histidinol-phosphate aminotransferase
MGYGVPESQANFILATRPGNPRAEQVYKNLKKKRVLVRYFSHRRLQYSLRITVGNPEQNERLLASLKAILNS